MDINKYKSIKHKLKPNYIDIPVTLFDLTDDGAKEFNEVYQYYKEKNYNEMVRTKSGGICVRGETFRPPCWSVEQCNLGVEIVVCDITGMRRFQFRKDPIKDKEAMPGRNSFNMFKKLCKEAGIDLDSYAITNGKEVKKTIVSAPIRLESDEYRDKIFENGYHLDYHSSYPAGLANTHPEFRPIIEKLYDERKINKKNKGILNSTIGAMQSIKLNGARWAHLSKDAIHNNNYRIECMANVLRSMGATIIAYNTDGIWFDTDREKMIRRLELRDDCGDKLGQFSIDHKKCKIRFKSAGVYEYIEDGKYNPVVRGRTNYDKVKDRSEWEWGDIYKNDCKAIEYKFDEERGIYKDET